MPTQFPDIQTTRTGLSLFQIYYSDATRRQVETGYEPLDNCTNERPDWREYWPIRRYFAENPPQEARFYGFLSPAFRSKTRLDPGAVLSFFDAHRDADVILFSPFFDQIAFFLNAWEQGALVHPGSMTLFQEVAALVAPEFRMQRDVGCSRNTVFCNYFIARGRFWREWLNRCERLFDCAESGATALGRSLRNPLEYRTAGTPAKVFVLERIASALLTADKGWRVAAFDPMRLPCSEAPINVFGTELAAMDALKLAYLGEGREQYLQAFVQLRSQLVQRLAANQAKPG